MADDSIGLPIPDQDTLIRLSLFSFETGNNELITAIVEYARSQSLLVPLLMHFIEDEINKTTDSTTLFREESVATRLLASYNYVESSIKFLKKIVSPLIKEVQNFKHGLEIDPRKAREPLNFEENCQKLIGTAEWFLNNLFSFVDVCPFVMRQILFRVQGLVKTRFVGQESMILGGIFFLRYICPAIVTPEKYKLVAGGLSIETRRTLILISKLLQNLSNRIAFDGSKEEYMVSMNPFIEQNQAVVEEIFKSLVNISDINSSKTQKPDKKEKLSKESHALIAKYMSDSLALSVSLSGSQVSAAAAAALEEEDHIKPSSSSGIAIVHPSKWKAQEVVEWLNENGFSDYNEIFLSNNIEGPQFVEIDATRMKQLGITKIGHSKRLTKLVSSLREVFDIPEDSFTKTLTADPLTWDESAVEMYLKWVGMGEYAPIFAEHKVTGQTLFSLDGDDLRAFGVTIYSHRKLITRQISVLRGNLYNEEATLGDEVNIECSYLSNVWNLRIKPSQMDLPKLMIKLQSKTGHPVEIGVRKDGSMKFIHDTKGLRQIIDHINEGFDVSLSIQALDLPHWTVDLVCDWLVDMGMEEIEELFYCQKIDGAKLVNMDEEDLRQLGIEKLGHRKRLIKEIKSLLTPKDDSSDSGNSGN